MGIFNLVVVILRFFFIRESIVNVGENKVIIGIMCYLKIDELFLSFGILIISIKLFMI